MAPSPDRPDDIDDDFRRLPLDPDVDRREDRRRHPRTRRSAASERGAGGSRWPGIHWRIVAAVGAGGFFGGLSRYAIGLLWDTPNGAFPYAIFAINTSGAFFLALLLVLLVELLPLTTYVRPALGTGFLGAYTTFSSVAVSADQLTAHGHAAVAVGYVAVSVFTGLAAAVFGLLLGRSIATNRASRVAE